MAELAAITSIGIIGATGSSIVLNTSNFLFECLRDAYRLLMYNGSVRVSMHEEKDRFYQVSFAIHDHIKHHPTTYNHTINALIHVPFANNAVVACRISMCKPGTWIQIPKYPDVDIEVLGDRSDNPVGYRIWSHRWGTVYGTKSCAHKFLWDIGPALSPQFPTYIVDPNEMMKNAKAEYDALEIKCGKPIPKVSLTGKTIVSYTTASTKDFIPTASGAPSGAAASGAAATATTNAANTALMPEDAGDFTDEDIFREADSFTEADVPFTPQEKPNSLFGGKKTNPYMALSGNRI